MPAPDKLLPRTQKGIVTPAGIRLKMGMQQPQQQALLQQACWVLLCCSHQTRKLKHSL